MGPSHSGDTPAPSRAEPRWPEQGCASGNAPFVCSWFHLLPTIHRSPKPLPHAHPPFEKQLTHSGVHFIGHIIRHRQRLRALQASSAASSGCFSLRRTQRCGRGLVFPARGSYSPTSTEGGKRLSLTLTRSVPEMKQKKKKEKNPRRGGNLKQFL